MDNDHCLNVDTRGKHSVGRKEKYVPWEPRRGATEPISFLNTVLTVSNNEQQQQKCKFDTSAKQPYQVDPVIYRTDIEKIENTEKLNSKLVVPGRSKYDSVSKCGVNDLLDSVPSDPVVNSDYDGTNSTSSVSYVPKSQLLEFTGRVEHVELKRNYDMLLQERERTLTEKQILVEQLDISNKVNAELKRLLVATMGDDLPMKLECLSYDKVRLTQDVVHYTQQLSEQLSEVEKVRIQSDVWRSKFLASSVLVDELTVWRIFLVRQVENAQQVLRRLLDDRKDLSPNLPRHLEIAAEKVLEANTSRLYGTSPCDEFDLPSLQQSCSCHPLALGTKNMTLNCCRSCHGEIKLV